MNAVTRNATICIGDRELEVEMEIDHHSSRGRESYEHFGFRGSNKVIEHEFSLDHFIATSSGHEVVDRRLLEQIEGEAEECIGEHHEDLAEAVGDLMD
jgi:hypothetical protein